MLGEMMDALRAIGLGTDDEGMRAGIDYLLTHQNADSSWGTSDENHAYVHYHATWGAITAMNELATDQFSTKISMTPVRGVA